MSQFSIVKHVLGAFVIKGGKAVALFPPMKTDLSVDYVIVYTHKLDSLGFQYAKEIKNLLKEAGYNILETIGNSSVCEALIRFYNDPPKIFDTNYIKASLSFGSGGILLENTKTNAKFLAHFNRQNKQVARVTNETRKYLNDPTGNYCAIALLDLGYYVYNPEGLSYIPIEQEEVIVNDNNRVLVEALNWSISRKKELMASVEQIEVFEKSLREQIKQLN